MTNNEQFPLCPQCLLKLSAVEQHKAAICGKWITLSHYNYSAADDFEHILDKNWQISINEDMNIG